MPDSSDRSADAHEPSVPDAVPQATTAEITAWVGGRLVGPGDLVIDGMQTLAEAQRSHLAYIGNPSLQGEWAESTASAALCCEGVADDAAGDRALIFVPDVDLATAVVLQRLGPVHPTPLSGVHELAVIDPAAQVDPSACIGPHCTIGAGVVIGPGSVLHSSVTLMARTKIGANCELFPGVVIREDCEIGDRCILHSNVAIGTDGFGYRPAADRKSLVKIPHRGTVKIGNDVEIGSNSCIDRGKFGATSVGDHTKLDNMVHIGHNSVVGRCVLMAGQTAIAGSVTIGDGVLFGGRAGASDHISIGAGAQIGVQTIPLQDVPPGKRMLGFPAMEARGWLRLNNVLAKLPETLRKLRRRGE